MGILDDAIRDHLALKRQSGAAQSDLKRLEDEAFGPPSRPGDPPSDSSPALTVEADPDAPAPPGMDQASPPGSAPEAVVLEEPTALEEPTVLDQHAAPASADAPPDEITIEPGADVDPAAEGPVDVSDMPAFHDFAAEEGLVSGADAPAPPPPAEPPEAPADETPAPPDETPAPPDETPAPPQQRSEPQPAEPPLDDTQPHDMAAELHTPEGHAVPPAEEVDVDADLDLDLDEEEELTPESVLPDAPAAPPPPRTEPPADRVEVVEEDGEDLEQDEDEELLDDDDVEVVEEDGDETEDDAEDVLEETPDFLRETPEHDRLWFEQRAPKDFDFDEE